MYKDDLMRDVWDQLMLTPLNRVEVDTLLNEFPQRTQLSQERDSLADGVEDIINLRGRRKAANTKANAAVSAFVAAAERSEHVTRLERSRRACAARRQCNVFQCHQQRLAFDIGKRDIDAARIAPGRIAVQGCVLKSQEPVGESLRQRRDAFRIILWKSESATISQMEHRPR